MWARHSSTCSHTRSLLCSAPLCSAPDWARVLCADVTGCPSATPLEARLGLLGWGADRACSLLSRHQLRRCSCVYVCGSVCVCVAWRGTATPLLSFSIVGNRPSPFQVQNLTRDLSACLCGMGSLFHISWHVIVMVLIFMCVHYGAAVVDTSSYYYTLLSLN